MFVRQRKGTLGYSNEPRVGTVGKGHRGVSWCLNADRWQDVFVWENVKRKAE